MVGRIRRPHGLGGEVMVESMTDSPDRYASGAQMHAVHANSGKRLTLTVGQARPHRGALRVAFEGIADRDQAETLRDLLLVVDRAQVPPAPEGAHYYFDLIGCQCTDRQLGLIGEVVKVVEDGGGILLSIAAPPITEPSIARPSMAPSGDADSDTAPGSAPGAALWTGARTVPRTAPGSAILIPFVDAYLISVDTENKSIEVDLPSGLVEICTSKS